MVTHMLKLTFSNCECISAANHRRKKPQSITFDPDQVTVRVQKQVIKNEFNQRRSLNS